MLSKLDLAVIVSIVGVVLWTEHGHRIVIEPPTPAESSLPAPTAACPDNDNQPYSASCIAFMGRGYAFGMNWQAKAADGATPRHSE